MTPTPEDRKRLAAFAALLILALIGCAPDHIVAPIKRHTGPFIPGDSSAVEHPATGTWVGPQSIVWVTPDGFISLSASKMRLYAQLSGYVTDHRFYNAQARYILRFQPGPSQATGAETDGLSWHDVPDTIAHEFGGYAHVAYFDSILVIDANLGIHGGPWPDQIAEIHETLTREP